MKNFIVLLISILCLNTVYAQTVVHDKNHFQQVLANHSVRLAAEQVHQSNLKNIEQSIQNINLNLASVVLVQDVVYRSLTEVKEVLNDGLMVKNMGLYVSDILRHGNELKSIAESDPYLLLFAEESIQWSRARVISLVEEVSNFILKNGRDAMMDYSKRDYLLKIINQELILMRSALYKATRSMYYAKRNGLLKSLNPYQYYINRDKDLVNQIIRNTNYLKK